MSFNAGQNTDYNGIKKSFSIKSRLTLVVSYGDDIVNISPICSEAPHGGISTKFCTAVEVVNLITCDKLFSNRLRYFDSVGDQRCCVDFMHFLFCVISV